MKYFAMNRFRIAKGREDVFEKLWRQRESFLENVPGFEQFHLLRGPSDEKASLFVSHTIWKSQAAFIAWTESDEFKNAHGKARAPEGTYLGPPAFEGFEVVM